jgi:hypothetical protein
MRKRSSYRPKPIITDPITHLLEGIRPPSTDKLLSIKIKNHDAMNSLLYGRATIADVDLLINMANMVEALYRLGFGREYKDVVSVGLDALFQVGSRGVASGRFVLKVSEIAAMNELMELHDAQLEVVTVIDMEKALALIQQEHRAKKMRKIGEKK